MNNIGRQAKQNRRSTEDGMDGGIDTNMEISYNSALKFVPNGFYNHLAWVITDRGYETGPEGRVQLKNKQHEQVLNIAQDICSAVAYIPMPKHVGMALYVHKKTHSTDIVTMLNKEESNFEGCLRISWRP